MKGRGTTPQAGTSVSAADSLTGRAAAEQHGPWDCPPAPGQEKLLLHALHSSLAPFYRLCIWAMPLSEEVLHLFTSKYRSRCPEKHC